jgi:predicted membrane channel-forming protein YqfA (hemolysin III family)
VKRLRGHLFSSKEQSTKALLSVILGSISLLASGTMIYLAYKNNGQAQLRYGGVVFICLFFALAGIILGILSRREPEKFYLTSYLGVVLNGAELVLGFILMYLGL